MDKNIKELEKQEFIKRDKELCLIASEGLPSEDILEASGSIFQLKYSEGFPQKRYYQGCEIVDKMEQECINAVLKLFDAESEYFANVQPNSGSSSNLIVYNAILQSNDIVLAMDTKSGSHISHSHPKSFIAKYHKVYTYGVNEDGFINYDEVEKLALQYKPKLIICGTSAYSQLVDFKRFKEIADKCDALLMADIAHISLLVAHGLHQSPVGLADFITFTTHKMLAGPRGAVILYKRNFDKQIKLSTIPSLFGGPLEHQIYAKLLCFKEAFTFESSEYSKQIIKNAKVMADTFKENDIPIITGSTVNHLMIIDLSSYCSGKFMAELLEECGIICNCNTIPNDKRSFLETSGVRLGVPFITKRGLNEQEVKQLTIYIAELIKHFKIGGCSLKDIFKLKKQLKDYVTILTDKYPLKNIYPKKYKRLFIEED